jgi:hypothetical protein
MVNSPIPANPGFNALTLCNNEAGRLSYRRESVIAWHIIGTDGIAQDHPSLRVNPILPGLIGVYDKFDAIEHPTGAVQTKGKTFKNIAEWLRHEETERANHEA